MGPQEGEEHMEPYLKLGCSMGRWGRVAEASVRSRSAAGE